MATSTAAPATSTSGSCQSSSVSSAAHPAYFNLEVSSPGTTVDGALVEISSNLPSNTFFNADGYNPGNFTLDSCTGYVHAGDSAYILQAYTQNDPAYVAIVTLAQSAGYSYAPITCSISQTQTLRCSFTASDYSTVPLTVFEVDNGNPQSGENVILMIGSGTETTDTKVALSVVPTS